ncbi:histidine kinase [Stenotrophomonas terrae]|uniref:sensor histidine kinase n=1 Tax=Stenotrophomonas terrae TaxID=405446 RepID=UPI00320AB926
MSGITTTTNGHTASPPHLPADAPEPLEVLWRPYTLVWIIMIGEALAMAMSLSPGVDGDRLILFGLNSLAIQWTTLLCLGLLYLFRKPLQKHRPTTIATAALGALLLSTSTTYLLLWLLLDGAVPAPAEGWRQLLFHMVALSLIFGLLGVAAFQSHWRNRLLALQAKQAELDALRARVDPHFLFNALNSAVALVRQNPSASERLLVDLADLFRAALSRSGTVPLPQELELSHQYLDIEATRFGERLTLDWRVPDSLPALLVPSLSLQPLMENAIRHGIEPSLHGGTLVVSVDVDPDWVTIQISNPFQAGTREATTGHQLGLRSTRSRLDAHFGGKAVVSTTTAADTHLTTVKLPRH